MRNSLLVMEIIARAYRARYPGIVAQQIAPDCSDVPAAMAALKVRQPQWFHPPVGG